MLIAAEGLFSRFGFGYMGLRWLHIFAGIAWIGLLYYFNFVQVPAFAAYGDDAKSRNMAIDKVARKALWYFRWSALSTFVVGILITLVVEDYYSNDFGKRPSGLAISAGMLMGTIMMLNVWGVIWRNQKVVLANAAQVLAGGAPDPDAAAAGRRAFMASRQNTVFSVAMLYFMVYRGHPTFIETSLDGGKVALFWIVTLVILAVMELNALGFMPWKFEVNKGLNQMYDGPGVRNLLVSMFGLWVIFVILTEICFRS